MVDRAWEERVRAAEKAAGVYDDDSDETMADDSDWQYERNRDAAFED